MQQIRTSHKSVNEENHHTKYNNDIIGTMWPSTRWMYIIVAVLVFITNYASCNNQHENNKHRQEMKVVFNPSVHVVTINDVNVKGWTMKLTNLAYNQPFGPIFMVTHNVTATSLFTVGNIASPELEFLAEHGSPDLLVTKYTNGLGVKSTITVGSPTEPLLPGKSIAFQFQTSDHYPLVSLATMAVNTNDCFAGFSNLKPVNGLQAYSPGYDAGTETNDELCIHIPGPACYEYNQTGTDANDAGEGFVHVHRGIHGIGNLDASTYDWRNPMLFMQIARMF